MLVSHRHKFIYTKTIKTAGTSIEVFFEPACREDCGTRQGALVDELVSDAGVVGYCGPDRRGKRWYDHMPAKAIRGNLTPSQWNDYFKFCVVRNPFEKLVSAFHFYQWLVEYYTGWNRFKLKVAHGLFSKRNDNEVKQFRKWVAWTWWFHDRKTYMIGNEVCMDYFIRHEQLLDGVKKVCDEVVFPYEPDRIPKLNTSPRSKKLAVAEYYDQQTIERVKKRFRFELDHFGYDLPR